MKTKLILSAFALALTIGLSAQNNQSSDSHKKVKTEQTENVKRQQREFPSEKMIKELSLTDKQVQEMKEIKKEQQQAREKMRSEIENNKDNQTAKPDREEIRKERESHKAEMDAKYKKVLSEEQFKKFEAMQNKEGKGNNGKPHGEKGSDKRKDAKRN